MLVANSFDLWRKDAFFSAAEEVQESADMYVPQFPFFLFVIPVMNPFQIIVLLVVSDWFSFMIRWISCEIVLFEGFEVMLGNGYVSVVVVYGFCDYNFF